MRIAILTSGGDAPGMNSCIEAITDKGIELGYEIFAFEEGLKGLYENRIVALEREDISFISGSVIKSSRFFLSEDAQQVVLDNLKKNNIDYLVIIGGDGSRKVAHQLLDRGAKVLFIPASIDNDIDSLECIGFDSALNIAMQNVDAIARSAESHNRNFLIEVMGNKCINIAKELALTSSRYLLYDDVKRLRDDFNIVIMPESASLEEVKIKLEKLSNKELRTHVVGHVQRGATPTARDRALAQRYGLAALKYVVENKIGDVRIEHD